VARYKSKKYNCQHPSDHSGQSFAKNILLEEEIEIDAAKSRIDLQLDFDTEPSLMKQL